MFDETKENQAVNQEPVNPYQETVPVQQAVEPIVAPVQQAVEPVVAPVQQVVEQTVAPVQQAVEPVVAPVQQAVEQTVAPMQQAVEPVVAPVQQVVEQTVAPVQQAVEQTVAPAQQAVEQASAPVQQAVEQTAVPMQQAVEQLQQQFTQQAQAFQNTQQFGGQAAQFTANPTPGAAPEAEQPKKKNSAVKVVVVLAIIAVVLLIAIIAIFLLGAFGGKKKVVSDALSATFKESGDYLSEVWQAEQYKDMFKDEKMTMNMEIDAQSVNLDVTMQQNKEVSSTYMEAGMAGTTLIEMEAYGDGEVIMVSIPNMLDYVFTVEMETAADDIMNLADVGILDEETAESLSEALKSGDNSGSAISEEATKQFKKDLLAAVKKFYKSTEVKNGDSKKLTYDGKARSCKGYVLVGTVGDFAVFCEDLMNAVEDNAEIVDYFESALSTGSNNYDIDDEFEDLRDIIEDLDEDDKEEEFEIEFYLYDGKVAQIYMEVDKDAIEWNFEGGAFPMENMSLYVDIDGDPYLDIIREGSMDDGEYSAAYTIIDEFGDEFTLEAFYATEDGDFEVEVLEDGDSLAYMGGYIEKTDKSTIEMGIDSIEVEGDEIGSADIVIENNCDKIKKPKGEELYILTLSKSEWEDLIDEFYDAIMELY